jgi:hypothetical protein
MYTLSRGCHPCSPFSFLQGLGLEPVSLRGDVDLKLEGEREMEIWILPKARRILAAIASQIRPGRAR